MQQVIRLSALMFTAMSLWAATAKAMPASDPDTLATKTHKTVPAQASGSDWTYQVGLGVGAVVVLVGGVLVSVLRRHTSAPVQA